MTLILIVLLVLLLAGGGWGWRSGYADFGNPLVLVLFVVLLLVLLGFIGMPYWR